jgi:hypothetical protein
MAVYTEAIQKLYVAYFARPADFGGLNFWENYLAGGGKIEVIAAEFAKSDEYKAAYGSKDAYNVVATVYQNLFGRMPDVDGLNFWAQGLMKGTFTVDVAVTTIAAGAQGSDATALTNKIAAATAFTSHLDTAAEILAYSGDAANLVAKNFIATVTDDASLTAAITDANINATISVIVDNGPGSVGQSFSLTQGQDVIVGTSGNDTINVTSFKAADGSAVSNMSTIDSIDGGAGKDTLNIQVSAIAGAAAAPYNYNGSLPASIKNVEIINYNLTDADLTATHFNATNTIDASKFVGATAINQIGHAVAVSNLGATTTAGFDTTTENMSVTASGATAAVSFNAVAEAATLAVGGTKLANVSISGNRFDTNDSGSLTALATTITAGTDIQTIKVTSNQSIDLSIVDTASAKKVTSLDASASTAKVKFIGDADVVTIATGSGGDDVTFAGVTSKANGVNGTVSTGAGNDTITVSGGLTGDGVISVDAGAGNDTITVTKSNGVGLNVQGGDGNDIVTLNGSLATTDVINGGAGTDTISVAGSATARVADDFIVFNKLLTGFETIAFATAEGSATVSLDASKLAANYTTIDLADGSYVAKVGSQAVIAEGALTVSATGYDATDPAAVVYAGTLNITEKADAKTVTANAETVNLSLKAGTAARGTTLVGDFEVGNVTVTNSVNSSTNPTADTIAKVTIDSANAAAMTSLTLTGTGSADVTNSNAGHLTMIDASGLGGTYTLGANAGKAIAGLKLVSTETSAETIKLGAGIDDITLNASTYGKVDSVQGLNLVWNSAHTALTAASDVLKIGSVAATLVKFTTTQTDLDLALKDVITAGKTDAAFVINGDTYVFHESGNGVVDSADVVVKLVGVTDVNAVILALGGTLV